MSNRSGDTNKQQNKSQAINRMLTVLIIISLIVMVVSGYIFVNKLLDYKQSEDEYEGIRELVTVTETESHEDKADDTRDLAGNTSGNEQKETSEEGKDELPPIQINFEELMKINPDVVGWIYINATETSYPILKGENNDTYIRTTMEGKDATAGSIFVEEQNSGDFTDPNTIVYGHSMRNGTMFGKIKQFLNNNAYEISPYFWILTPEGNYKYKIFSYYETDVSSEVYTLFDGRDMNFVEWCKAMQRLSIGNCGPQEFTEEDHVVTLSTCAVDAERRRRIVQGICISGNIPVTEGAVE